MDFKFSEICYLLETIECIDKKAVRLSLASKIQKEKCIHDWFCKHRSLLLAPPGDQAVIVLSCLFPESRADRVYGLFKNDFVRSITKALAMQGTDREKQLLQRIANKEELAAVIADAVALAVSVTLDCVTVQMSLILLRSTRNRDKKRPLLSKR
jgi:hypothetical protein